MQSDCLTGKPANRLTGKLFVISAPSGCGKTTLCNKLINDNLGLSRSISMTTRPARAGEKDGIDYRFVSKKRFEDMIKRGEFLEYEDNFGQLYGTPKRFIENKLHKGKSVLLSIDVKGAMKVRRARPKNSVLIFILPPSVKTLKERLKQRKSDGPDAISKRLALAKKEMSRKGRYDYTVVNKRLDSAHRRLKKIVVSELSRQ